GVSSLFPAIARLDLASNCLFCYRPIGHKYKLPDRPASAFENRNWIARCSLSRYFPGDTDRVLEVIGGSQRVVRTLVDNVELGHTHLLKICFTTGNHLPTRT